MTRGVEKVPQIMQMEALECGAACLAMIKDGLFADLVSRQRIDVT